MSTTLAAMFQSKVISNLDTYSYVVGTTAPHLAKIVLTEIPPSGVSIVIKQNSTTIATSTAPSVTQNHIELSASINATSGDTVSFVITSSSAIDQGPQAIKGVLQVTVGSGLN